MTDLWVNATNRALSYARIELRMLQQAEAESGWSQGLQREALESAIGFHLKVAFSLYLKEIAERNGLASESIESLDDLVKAQLQADIATSEVSELSVLADRRNSWLNQLEARYERSWTVNARPMTSPSDSISEISVRQLDHSANDGVGIPLEGIYEELSELINRHRSAMQEW